MRIRGFRMQAGMCMGMMDVQDSLRSLAACPKDR